MLGAYDTALANESDDSQAKQDAQKATATSQPSLPKSLFQSYTLFCNDKSQTTAIIKDKKCVIKSKRTKK